MTEEATAPEGSAFYFRLELLQTQVVSTIIKKYLYALATDSSLPAIEEFENQLPRG